MDSLISNEDSRSVTPTMEILPLRESVLRTVAGRYHLRRLIGRGGMADVYLGDDLLLERDVAIKILHQHIALDDSGLERFRREALALAALVSPHVVAVYDVGLDKDCAFLVMHYIDGNTIEQQIIRHGPMSAQQAEAVLVQVLDGLTAIHSCGLIHRDIKPSNVLIDANDHVVLLDFGIALHRRRAPLTAPGMVAGTPGYLAPECDVELTSDLFQVGLLMVYLLTGVEPARFISESKTIDSLLIRVPCRLADVARRALATDPAQRFESAETMKEAVRAAASPWTASDERTTIEMSPVQLLGLIDTAPVIASEQKYLRVGTNTNVVQTAPTCLPRSSAPRRSRVRMPIIRVDDVDEESGSRVPSWAFGGVLAVIAGFAAFALM
jgi:serine/threonine-protein kinase